MDPDRDGCGLLWCSPILPMDGAQIEAVTAGVSAIMLQHGFEPQISLGLVTGRAVACVVSICYDRDVAGEDERATVCHRDLLKALAGQGYPCYRLGLQSMTEMDGHSGYHNLIRTLKKVLDPSHILSPGRYQPPVPNRTSSPMEVAATAPTTQIFDNILQHSKET
jgi:4-cresol dehydrogenase (hydroxylating)